MQVKQEIAEEKRNMAREYVETLIIWYNIISLVNGSRGKNYMINTGTKMHENV